MRAGLRVMGRVGAGGGPVRSWGGTVALGPMSPISSARRCSSTPLRKAVSPTSAQLLPYTDRWLPSSATAGRTARARRPSRPTRAARQAGVRGGDGDAGPQPGAGELGGVLVGYEPAAVDGDDAVGDRGPLPWGRRRCTGRCRRGRRGRAGVRRARRSRGGRGPRRARREGGCAGRRGVRRRGRGGGPCRARVFTGAGRRGRRGRRPQAFRRRATRGRPRRCTSA